MSNNLPEQIAAIIRESHPDLPIYIEGKKFEAMSEGETESWRATRTATIQVRLRAALAINPVAFWDEVDRTVAQIVMCSVDLGDTDWHPNLDLADVVEKRIGRAISNLCT